MMQTWTKDWLDRPAAEISRGDGIRGVTCSPVYGLRIVVKEERRPEILKLDEMRKLLSEARAVNHEWYFVWAVALLTGMRNGEFRWSDVDLDKGLITVQRSFNKRTGEFKSTKAGYWRTVPVSGELRGLLMVMRGAGAGKTTTTRNRNPTDRDDDYFVFPRIDQWRQGQQAKILKQFCNSVGLPPIKFHTLRACFATQLISEGVEPIK